MGLSREHLANYPTTDLDLGSRDPHGCTPRPVVHDHLLFGNDAARSMAREWAHSPRRTGSAPHLSVVDDTEDVEEVRHELDAMSARHLVVPSDVHDHSLVGVGALRHAPFTTQSTPSTMELDARSSHTLSSSCPAVWGAQLARLPPPVHSSQCALYARQTGTRMALLHLPRRAALCTRERYPGLHPAH